MLTDGTKEQSSASCDVHKLVLSFHVYGIAAAVSEFCLTGSSCLRHGGTSLARGSRCGGSQQHQKTFGL